MAYLMIRPRKKQVYNCRESDVRKQAVKIPYSRHWIVALYVCRKHSLDFWLNRILSLTFMVPRRWKLALFSNYIEGRHLTFRSSRVLCRPQGLIFCGNPVRKISLDLIKLKNVFILFYLLNMTSDNLHIL